MIFKKVIYGEVTVFHVILAIGIVILASLLIKIINLNLRRHLKDRVEKDRLSLITKIINYTLIVLAFISILPILGINLSGLIVAGGITGLVIGFASQKIVSNLISGLFLIVERPVKIGQQIRVEDIAGIVEDIRIISTIIRTYDGLYVRVPNEKVFTSNITNFVANIVRRFEYVVGIRYSDNADRAIKIIKKLIEEHPLALIKPKPQAFVDNLGDNSVNIVVRIWSPATEWYDVKMEMLWKIKKTLEEEGIEIAFPQRVVWFGNELKLTQNQQQGRYEG
ncbi:MAG: mechanosensitive ion channel family protein [Nitrospirae bacterium]|nr:MAG: mechanosensitive ion channel family protein [Nitrospirota bacterium]